MKIKDEIQARIKTIRQEADTKISALKDILRSGAPHLDQELNEARQQIEGLANIIRPPT